MHHDKRILLLITYQVKYLQDSVPAQASWQDWSRASLQLGLVYYGWGIGFKKKVS